MSKKKGVGRPSDYRKAFNNQAFKLSLLGATSEQMADFFNVSHQTLDSWKNKHADFLAAIKKGKDEADTKVADSLYHRALGYSHREDKIFLHEGKPVTVKTIKHYPPETVAAIFWLKNRQKAAWRDKVELEHSGEMGIVFKEEKTYEKIDETLDKTDDSPGPT